jgi:hypothetical protein
MGTTPSPTPIEDDFAFADVDAPPPGDSDDEADVEESSTGEEGGAALATRTATLAPRLGRSVTDPPPPRDAEEEEDDDDDAPPEAPFRPSDDPTTPTTTPEEPPTLRTPRFAASTPAGKVVPATANALAILSLFGSLRLAPAVLLRLTAGRARLGMHQG